MSECVWVNPWTDSGDRGAAAVDHERFFHPDHEHVWEDSPYGFEQKGQPHIAKGDRDKITPRPETVVRCVLCHIRPEEDQKGKCAPHVTW